MLPYAFWPEDSVGVFLGLDKRIYEKPTPETLNGRLHFILFSYRVLNSWRKRMGCHQATKRSRFYTAHCLGSALLQEHNINRLKAMGNTTYPVTCNSSTSTDITGTEFRSYHAVVDCACQRVLIQPLFSQKDVNREHNRNHS